MDETQAILGFWFEGVDDAAFIDKNKPPFRRWFAKDSSFDREMKDRFESDLTEAAQGKRQAWEKTPEGKLALILLFDQFARNIYRDTEKMYAFDALAQKLALPMIANKEHSALPLVRQVFVYMPLMHAEDRDLQRLSFRCFEQLVEVSKRSNPDNSAYFEYHLKYARRHLDIVERFGRFPHRNGILGRASTQEELKWKN
jgi:uncharacterized protein (DUF924 family)